MLGASNRFTSFATDDHLEYDVIMLIAAKRERGVCPFLFSLAWLFCFHKPFVFFLKQVGLVVPYPAGIPDSSPARLERCSGPDVQHPVNLIHLTRGPIDGKRPDPPVREAAYNHVNIFFPGHFQFLH